MAEILKELEEEDLVDADKALLVDIVFCLGHNLWYCKACLYVCYNSMKQV